jgi:cytoskeleton protein RodZ
VGEFGDKFRKAREAKKISLDDASNVTKIGARMLQAIEEEKFDLLPGGVFNKGFIRAYAKHLGINDEEAVTEYLACLRRVQLEAQAAWEPPVRKAAPTKWPVAATSRSVMKEESPAPVEELPGLQLPRPEHVRPPRQKYLERNDGGISWRLWAVVAVVLVLALVLWRRHTRAVENAELRAPAPVTQAAPAADTAAPVPASPPSTVQSGVSTGGEAAPRAPAPVPSPNKGSSSATKPPGESHAAATEPANPDANSGENEVTTRPVVAAPAAAAAAPLMLVIRATENSWISVSADGKTVSRETLIAPANTSIRASREIVAKVGNAAGVTFLWNGQEIPAQGNEAEVKTFVFDAGGMRVVAASQSPTIP